MNKFLFTFLLLLLPITSIHAAKPWRILIEPGHDDQSWGAQFNTVKEADMNVKLGLMLYDQLKQDKNFEVFLVRDWNGYRKEFADYFQNNAAQIKQFMDTSVSDFNQKISSGEIKEFRLVNHNKPTNERALTLYGLNKWANENNIDAFIHIHFNDNPRTNTKVRGDHQGFAVYVPHESLKNSKASSSLGFFIYNSLLKDYHASNFIQESSGVVPDQGLISVGANNSLNTRSVLIEYGYIYEKIFSTFSKREAQMKIMADRTHEGIKKYFDYVPKKK